MKKLLCLSLVCCIGILSFAQQRATIPKQIRDLGEKRVTNVINDRSDAVFENPALKSPMAPLETQIGDSYYDWQTNATMQNRFYYYDDGTFVATWMNGYAHPNFNDRGTAYTYFDGNAWSGFPTERIESQRSGWGNYWPLGENGEILISHISGGNDDGLLVNRRTEKGSGEWDEYLFEGPAGGESIIWPYSVVSGIDNNTIHMLYMTRPVEDGGSLYQGINGAMLYSRSTDGGDTWDIQHAILDELSSENFASFSPDQYAFAPPRGGVLAFVVGGTFTEAFLMKSLDNGETWEKTMIWEHPYPMWNGEVTDTFYCPDGSWDVKLDNSGMAHAVFGINRAHSDGSGTYWFPFVDGVGYWNETMPAFSGTLEALNPVGEEGSELIEDYNLVGWSQDVDGDGEVTLIGESIDNIGRYYLGLSSMVQLVMGESNQLYVIWSSVTETYSNELQNYRHLWSRVSPDGGITWGPFTDLSENIVHIFDECVWPDAAINSDPESLYLIYEYDNEPGMALSGDEDPFGINNWNFMEVSKDDITGINKHKATMPDIMVYQNYPNPFSGRTDIRVDMAAAGPVSLEVMNVMGQLVYQTAPEKKPAGTTTFTFESAGMAKGIYFFTVKSGTQDVTKKMIIE